MHITLFDNNLFLSKQQHRYYTMSNTWLGIADPSDNPERVWFSKRKNSEEPWIPLRCCDCEALNKAQLLIAEGQDTDGSAKNKSEDPSSQQVLIEFGRATADLQNNVIRNNFYNVPIRELTSAIWYTVDTSGSNNAVRPSTANSRSHNPTTIIHEGSKSTSSENKHVLVPIISANDEVIIECLYQEAVSAQLGKVGSKGKYALDYVLDKEMNLQDDSNYKVYVDKSNTGILRIRKRPKAFISIEGYTELQRGYGNYVVEGEKEESSLGPVRHLSFIVHGIGEAMWSKEEVSTSSLIDEVNHVRTTVYKKMYNNWKLECERVSKANKSINDTNPHFPPPPDRIEFIPIEWYGQIHSSSSKLKNDLISSTLTTVPKLRSIANDVIFDVLVYNTPEFCGKVLDCVTTQICDLYDGFQIIHPHFVKNGGKCSIIGHSLGSVIAWDMLSILSDRIANQGCIIENEKEIQSEGQKHLGYSLPSQIESSRGYEAYIRQTESNLDEISVGTWGPTTMKSMTKTIPFVPSFTFFLGSPIGLFLTLRGARPLFQQMSNEKIESVPNERNGQDNFVLVERQYHQASPFHLPSGSVYNIFSPSDPVAYRIEPLLLPADYPHETPAPCFLTPGGKGLRFHVKAKEIGDSLMRSFSGLIKNSLDKIPDKIPTNLGDTIEGAVKGSIQTKTPDLQWKFPLGGHSTRVDYQLQPGVVENEYLAAISAHNTYMRNDDLLEFWIECANQDSASKVIPNK